MSHKIELRQLDSKFRSFTIEYSSAYIIHLFWQLCIVEEGYKRIREMFRPFAGLFHLTAFTDEIRPFDKEKFNTTLLDFNIGKKGMYMPLKQVKENREEYLKKEISDNFDLYPNMKMIFLVRDPRSFVSARLRRARSKSERKEKFLNMLQYWYKLNHDLVKICDSFPGRCHLLRHEDLIIRPAETINNLISTKLRLPISQFSDIEIAERNPNYNLTNWSSYLPESTESILIDMLPLLERLGYRPDITDSSQYKKIDLNPRGDPLLQVEISENDLYETSDSDLRNI